MLHSGRIYQLETSIGRGESHQSLQSIKAAYQLGVGTHHTSRDAQSFVSAHLQPGLPKQRTLAARKGSATISSN